MSKLLKYLMCIILVILVHQMLAKLENPQLSTAFAESKSVQKATGTWTYFRATFYNAKCKGCSKHTKSGNKLNPTRTLSVDPRVIPLGTWVEIEFPNGHKEIRRADDTGGKIKGRRVDIYYPKSRRALLQMGVQKVKIRILKSYKPKNA